MSFVSKNPMNNTNPEVGDNPIIVSSKTLQPETQFIGFYKNKFTDKNYNVENYVIKCEQTGRDILIFGVTSLTREMSFYDFGQRLQLVYKGMLVNKEGKFRGKESHIWKVAVDSSFEPDQNFIASLQAEVAQRRQQIYAMHNNQGNQNQYRPTSSHQPQFNQQNNQPQNNFQQNQQSPSYNSHFTPNAQGSKNHDPFS
jgi:hypothetical protein